MAVVADALVSKVLDVLVSTIATEFRHLSGVEEEVEKLTSSLQSIQAVLADAERRQWKEPTTVQHWLDRLKNLAYDIDDVVDEWSYKILRSQAERIEHTTHMPRRKVWRFSFRYACYCFPRIVSRHHLADKINDLNVRLGVIAAEKDRHNFQPTGVNIIESNIEHNITTSIIDISEVRGRDDDKEKLVSLLLSGNNEQKELRVIPVVGMGGIGKTTLARLVYNDKRVESHFHKRIWICVSDPFDEIRIAKEILESLLGAKPNLDALPNIMKEIQELVGEEKCLFVLDDVWNEDHTKWEQLKDCLKGSASKSSILTTTRKEKVGRIMGCLKSDVVRVRELSKEDSWELFCMISFFGRSNEERVSLEKIGREVVERCKGLPLAIKAIASLLKLKEDRKEWQSLLDSELWNWKEFQQDIAPALWLSYFDLPSHLKECFSFCAIFPKDFKMEKGKLISHWVAHGYIKGRQSKDLGMIGEECFQNLVMRSFFQDVQVSMLTTTCKMHDIVHDYARLLVKKECCSIEVNDMNEEVSFHDDSFPHSLLHLSISFQNKVKFVDSFYKFKKLHSLIVSSSSTWLSSLYFRLDLQKLFNEFTLLRSLVFSNCGIEEVPCNINRLIHLRELDLSCNAKLKELPDTVWGLYNLRILNLEYTGIKSLKGIGRLANLWYLGIIGTECYLPKEMVRLHGLRRVNRVSVNVDNEEALSLKDLKNFNQLVGLLIIRWLKRGDGDVNDAKQAQLTEKKHITLLWLDLGPTKEEEMRKKQDEELVEALNAPPNLESLGIEDYMGSATPKWLNSLAFVKMVRLNVWWNVEHLPPLGNLLCLEQLELLEFERVVKVGAEFLGIDETAKPTTVAFFPKLRSLFSRGFNNWEEWKDEDEEILIMPSLTSLTILGCTELKALPNFILRNPSIKLNLSLCHVLEKKTSSNLRQ